VVGGGWPARGGGQPAGGGISELLTDTGTSVNIG
jgi:hypothetical protein